MNRLLPETLYVVQSIPWEFVSWFDGPRYQSDSENEGVLEQAFADPDEAAAHCAELERQKRAEVNPFAYCEQLGELTPFDADRWHDWILDAGLEPPHGSFASRGSWLDWWNEQSPNMTELQRAKMWQAMDTLRFYRVVELQASAGW